MTYIVICPNCLEIHEYFARLSVTRTNRTLFLIHLAQSHEIFDAVARRVGTLVQALFLVFVLLYIENYIF